LLASARPLGIAGRALLGVNFAPAIGNPFRSFGGYDGLETSLALRHCGPRSRLS
jgi:hypothetical protein